MTPVDVQSRVEAQMQTLQRYACSGDHRGRMLEWPAGEFVGFDDVRELLVSALLASETQQQKDSALIRKRLEALVTEWEQNLAEQEDDEFGRERYSTREDDLNEIKEILSVMPLPAPPETP